eukprot:6755890-Karenia_brevis.AAC.1
MQLVFSEANKVRVEVDSWVATSAFDEAIDVQSLKRVFESDVRFVLLQSRKVHVEVDSSVAARTFDEASVRGSRKSKVQFHNAFPAFLVITMMETPSH